ncbi:hypothetical protein OG519_20135 [Streptomyces sp. NBC_01190]|nr:hypothetical protein OG519_20135 [Streptomyces sp. NBC_01190]
MRLFGTSWVAHDRGYGMRRVAVAIGSLLAALAGALALGFGLMGLVRYGPGVTSLGVAGFVACAVLGFSRTWKGFTRRRPPAGHHSTSSSASSSTSLYALGFVGTLFAYFLRTFTEAPGEGLRRAEYEAARADHARRRAARSGNPAAADPRST